MWVWELVNLGEIEVDIAFVVLEGGEAVDEVGEEIVVPVGDSQAAAIAGFDGFAINFQEDGFSEGRIVVGERYFRRKGYGSVHRRRGGLFCRRDSSQRRRGWGRDRDLASERSIGMIVSVLKELGRGAGVEEEMEWARFLAAEDVEFASLFQSAVSILRSST